LEKIVEVAAERCGPLGGRRLSFTRGVEGKGANFSKKAGSVDLWEKKQGKKNWRKSGHRRDGKKKSKTGRIEGIRQNRKHQAQVLTD